MEQVILHPAAEAELRDAVDFYEECRTGLGEEFLTAVETVLEIARLHPESGRLLREPFRRFQVTRFPFSIIYSKTRDTIYVTAIMHLKREPGYWLDRIGEV